MSSQEQGRARVLMLCFMLYAMKVIVFSYQHHSGVILPFYSRYILICTQNLLALAYNAHLGGYGVFTKIRADVNIVPVGGLSISSALTSEVVFAVKTAYSSVLDSTRIKSLLVTNPHNPIGRCYSPSLLKELMAFCKDKGLQYISDETFAMSAFGSEREGVFTSALAIVDGEKESPISPNSVHVIYSMSKDFCCAGARMVRYIHSMFTARLKENQGCIVSRNRPVLEGSMLANYLQTSVLNSIFVTSLLASPELPSILASLKSRLACNHALLTQALEKWGVEYLPTDAGFHIYAKLAKHAQTWEEEAEMITRLSSVGVMVVPGKSFGGVDGQTGWVRLGFSIPENKLKSGLEIIEKTLGFEKEVEEL